MKLSLPPSEHYQYFSHLFHGNKLTPFSEYQPLLNWDYPENDRQRFETLFLTDPSYYQNCHVLDLGCHTGYFSYIAKYLGAKSVHGVNARAFPLDVANFAYRELNQQDYKFDQGNIEDFDFLKSVCKNKDTVILTLVLEHMRNPYAIMEIIANSDIKNLILESSVFSDEGEPAVKYYRQSTESPFTVFDGDKTEAFGSIPNVAWFESILYHFGWKIEYNTVEYKFNKNWFAEPNLTKLPPKTPKTLTILCKKFSKLDINNKKNTYES